MSDMQKTFNNSETCTCGGYLVQTPQLKLILVQTMLNAFYGEDSCISKLHFVPQLHWLCQYLHDNSGHDRPVPIAKRKDITNVIIKLNE